MAEGEREELRHAQPSRKTQVEHGAIPDARTCVDIRGIENGVHLRHREVCTSDTAVFLDAQRRAAPAGHPSQGGRASASKAQGERS